MCNNLTCVNEWLCSLAGYEVLRYIHTDLKFLESSVLFDRLSVRSSLVNILISCYLATWLQD
jgi:hypothetical protein